MKSAWSTIACIVLLAATAGFAIGYLATFGRVPHAANPQSSSSTLAARQPALIAPSSPQLANSAEADQLVYFPETVLADAEALAPDQAASGLTNDSEPGILPDPSSSATPLPTPGTAQLALEQLIESEFGLLSDQEREVWLDVLGGLPLEDAAGILRLWKLFGRGTTGDLRPGLIAADPLIPAPPLIDIPTAEGQFVTPVPATLATIRQIRQMVIHNLLNAETHGYRRFEPLLSDTAIEMDQTTTSTHELTSVENRAQSVPGVMLDGRRIDQRPGAIQHTNNSMDVAISGHGFFIVQQGASTLYTRCGRFRTDAQGRLVLDQADHAAVLQPELIVPSDADEIFIDPEGDVQAVRYGDEPRSIGRLELATFRDPARLHPAGATLFRETVGSGPANRHAPHSAQTGWLQQRALESSNVQREQETARLAWLDQLAREIARPQQ